MNIYNPGDKIQFMLPDKDGKPVWFDGVVHGVKQYEKNGLVEKVAYLIDTGRNERVDEYPFDHRDRELNKQIQAEQKKGADIHQAIKKVIDRNDLPPSKLDVEISRQPEQIELTAEFIRSTK
jgi:hypothetical protein